MIRATESQITEAFGPIRRFARSNHHWALLIQSVRDHLTGDSTEQCTDGVIRLSADRLLQQLSSWLCAVPREHLMAAHVALTNAIDHVRLDLGWPICAPPIPIRPKILPSALRGEFPHDAAIAAIWAEARAADTAPEIRDENEGVGELLLALVLDNGIGCRRLLDALLRQAALKVQTAGGYYWLNVIQPHPTSQYVEFRRVLLRPGPAMLCIRFGAQAWSLLGAGRPGTCVSPRQSGDRLLQAIVSRLDRAGVPPQWHPKSMTHVMRAAAAFLRLRQPGFVAAYATGALQSTSVPDHAFLRQLGIRALPVETSVLNSPAGSASGEMEDLNALNPFCAGLVESFRQPLEVSRRPDQVIDALDVWKTATAPPPSACALAEWSISRLKRLTRGVASGSTTRVVQHTLALAPIVFGLFGRADPCQMGLEDLTLAQWEMIDLVLDRSDPVGTARLISQFLLFCAQCTDSSIKTFGRLSISKTPNANLFAFGEMDRASTRLRNGRFHTPGPDMEKNMLTLMAAGSITLRTSEARGLLGSELHLVGDSKATKSQSVTACARNNTNRNLKNRHSERNLPGVITSEAQEQILVERARSIAASGSCEGVFGAAEFKKPNEDWQVARPLQRLMQEISGDPSMRPYHLRHSAASRVLLALCARFIDLSSIASIDFVREAIRLSGRIGDALLNRFDLRRDLLWVVALVMGHMRPQRSANDYVHVMDLILYAALESRGPRLTHRSLRIASGLPRSSVYRHLGSAEAALVTAVERAHPGRVLRHEDDRTQAADAPNGSRTALFERLNAAHHALIRSLTSKSRPSDPQDALQRKLLEGFRILAKQPSGRRGSPLPRHRLVEVANSGERIPAALTSPECVSAAVALCDALQAVPMSSIPALAAGLDAYVSGAHAKRAQIRFQGSQEAKAFIDALHAGSARVKAQISAKLIDPDQLTVSIIAAGRDSDRGSREAVWWVFQLLSAIRVHSLHRSD